MQKMYIASMMLIGLLPALPQAIKGQGSKVKITATGTGNTTGHIANLTIHNMEKTDIRITEQTVYIPSDGRYQPYITIIPDRTIPPGVTTIPLDGYCADVHTPPVGPRDGLPPIDTWVDPNPTPTIKPTGTDFPVVTNVVPPFTPEDIPEIITTPGFTPNPPPKTTPIPTGIITTWPGTDIPVNGTFDPVEYPKAFAPVIIDALEKIVLAFDKLKGEGTITTPFSGDPEQERESVIQQTLWIYAAGLTGKKYKKENFGDKVVEQFETNTGTKVTAMPEPEKKKLDGGVDAFWNTFMATGTQAKVLREPDKTTSANTVPVQDSPGIPEEYEKPEDRECICDTIRMNLVIRHIHDGTIVTDVDEPVTLTSETDELKRTIRNVDNDEKLTFTLSDVEAKCSCSYGEVDCQDYGSRNEKGGLGNRDEVKIRTDNTENCDVETKPVKTAGTSFSFVIKADASKKDDKEGVSIDIIVTAHCKSDDCNPSRSDKCEKTITIKLSKPAE